MIESERQRCRVLFDKTQAMRFTGHLDLYRALERTIRRAALPLAYSQGFSPHPKLQLAAALPLGFTSRAEIADLWLEQAVDPAHVLARLQDAAPPGLAFRDAAAVASREPALQKQVAEAAYDVDLEDPVPPDLETRIALLLATPELRRQRRGKEYDLRPLLISLELARPGRLRMQLSAREGATGRPEAVLEALGLDPLAARVERTALIFAPRTPEPVTA
jgi:radical SAM-linked protein